MTDAYPPISGNGSDDAPLFGRRGRIRLAWTAGAALALVLLTTLPPLVNVNRYQHRVAEAISGSVGRPVHFDRISVHLLPLPGLTIENFVVQEDPAFGSEPAMRANIIEARLRLSSLWSRRIEISRISLQAPSINLVRRDDGSWSLLGVLNQASHLQSAPTAQRGHGQTPRFPYIEASEARVNLKLGQSKLPYSLVDANFALWLPEEKQWHLRLEGRPLRTDTDVSDVGEVQMEATLGRGGAGTVHQPLYLHGSWDPTPIGEASKLVLGNDAGWRGEASGEMEIRGTAASMHVTSDVHLQGMRRSDFLSPQTMSVDAHCTMEAAGVLHSLHHLHCAIPTAHSDSIFESVNLFHARPENQADAPDALILNAEVPNALDLRSATASLDLQRGSPAWVISWARLLSRRIPRDLKAGGVVGMHADWNAPGTPAAWNAAVSCRCVLPAALPSPSPAAPADATGAPQSGSPVPPAGSAAPAPVRNAVPAESTWMVQFVRDAMAGEERDFTVQAVPLLDSPAPPHKPAPAAEKHSSASLESPAEKIDPASEISGRIGRSGYTLQYPSGAAARFSAALLPPLGDSLPETAEGPLLAHRRWGLGQTWTTDIPAAAHAPRRSTFPREGTRRNSPRK